MGAQGVQVRPNSIRLSFSYAGTRHQRTLYLNGAPLTPTPANIKYAERLAAEIREKIRLGTFSFAEYFPADRDTDSCLSFPDMIENWIRVQRIETSTRSGYLSALRFWSVLDKPLKSIKHSDLLAVLANTAITGKTVNNYVSVGRSAMDLAVTDGLIQSNPFNGVKRAKHQKDPPDPFTAEERDAIIDYARERYPGQVANMLEFWFWSGPRTSEIFGLNWGKIDLMGGSFMVSQALVRGERKDTKTNTARVVKLNSHSKNAIERQRKHTHLANGPVFQDPRYDTPWTDERAFRRSFWKPCLKALGIRYRRPYNMRHTYATAMLMAGMAPAFCARQLGHSVEVFLRTYAKWIDGALDDREMAKLENSLGTIRAHFGGIRGNSGE